MPLLTKSRKPIERRLLRNIQTRVVILKSSRNSRKHMRSFLTEIRESSTIKVVLKLFSKVRLWVKEVVVWTHSQLCSVVAEVGLRGQRKARACSTPSR